MKAVVIKEYSRSSGFNNTSCFMVDIKIASSKNRFFVYNLKKDSIEMAGLVAHGSGKKITGSIQF